ncbi:MAG: M23 family metallopeptidase [Deltaproteobacteria bacterium]|nr:M23 family metallopeptidase [Deltaproteobacteria bacterium]MCW5804808.1 M23 family metallopeptidase [Deltaproteobacteria bacterium]
MKLALAIGVVLALPLQAAANPIHLVTLPKLTDPTPFARLRNVVGVEVVDRFVDDMVKVQILARDFASGARRKLDWLASRAAAVPDVSVLTTNPVAQVESSGFGWRDDPITHTPKFHSGADLRGKYGTPVLAAGDGVVEIAGYQGGYGFVVYVDHGGGVTTRYAHLQKIHTKKGSIVTAGTKLGEVGATGRATGPHLHFEVRLEGRPVDPITAMTVGELSRESPEAGQIAAFALAPDLQHGTSSRTDPPKGKIPAVAKKKIEQRPERKGHVARKKPLS